MPGGGSMKRLALVGALVLLAGCMPQTRPQTAAKSAPGRRADLPRIVHRVVLTSPAGTGTIGLGQGRQMRGTVETPVYRAYGGILVSDDVARWRFTYIRTSLEGPGAAPSEWVDGLHAMSVILANVTRGDLEIDWERSTFIDATGRSQRVIHRGV